MARSQSAAGRPAATNRSSPSGRPSLVPEHPLPGWQALLQALFLLGVPILLLWVVRFVLAAYMPELGY